jgi:hypothetical protein
MATTPITTEQTTNVPDPQRSAEEQRRVIPALEPWDDRSALDIVLRDFREAETYRFQNHDRRFKAADEVYLAWVAKKTWEDTKIPRASLPVFLALSQVQALKPALLDALFSDDPPFGTLPHGDTTWQQAVTVQELIRHQMDGLDEKGIVALRQLVSNCVDSSLIYGNGILEWGWLAKKVQRIEYTRRMNPRMMSQVGPDGQPAYLPSGEYDLSVTSQQVEHAVNKPICQFTQIQDFYIDPHCSGPDVQLATHCETRHWRTVEELSAMRGTPGFDIPPDDVLRELAAAKTSTFGDQTKQQQEVYRGNWYTPQRDYTDDPAMKRIEVLRYWRPNRHVWILSRKWVAHNKPNCYNALPFLNMNYIPVLGRFYGLSICDLVEGDQKLIESLLNARVDEVNLNVHPPIVRRRGMSIPPSARRLRPGVVWEIDGDPQRDVVRMQMGNVTQDSHIEVDAAERRVQKTTGITDTGMMGIGTSGGNSANRTATGINTQSAAASRRVQMLIEDWETMFMYPLCNILLAMDKRFLNPEEIINIVGQDGNAIQIDPMDILNASVKFEFKASSKMRSRGALQSGGLQVIMETFANPAFLELQAKMGYQLNTPALVEMVADALNVRGKDLFMQIQPQVQASLNQPSGDQQLRMQMQRERLDAQDAMAQDKNAVSIMQTIGSKIITPDVAHDVVGLPPPAAIAATHKPPRKK